MADVRTADCLSFGDTLFLYLERPGAPLHVASLCIFEGILDLNTCLRYVESKLPLIPRYRQVIVPAPFGLGMPVWEYAQHFSVRDHVHEIRMKRGTQAELRNIVGDILSTSLDRTRPLWSFALISGLKNKQTAILMRVHHCLADGISGVGLMNVLLDTNPVPARLPRRLPRFNPPPRRNQPTQVLDGFITAFFTAIERILAVDSGLISLSQQLGSALAIAGGNGSNNNAASAGDPGALNAYLPEFAASTERLPFNTLCHGPQMFRWTEVPFNDIRAIKRSCGTTVNDVILALVATSLCRYARTRGVSTEKRILRIVVPVNVRAKNDEPGLGNQITFLPMTVPMDIHEAPKMLSAVHERMGLLKTLRVAELVGLAGTLLGTVPTPAQAVLAPMISQLPISLCNTICTNVPGPQNTLYLHGHRLLACYPYVPIGGEMGMNCAVLTYDGKAFFGFTGDTQAIPDLELLPRFLQESFEELRKAVLKAGVKPKRRQTVAVKSGSATPEWPLNTPEPQAARTVQEKESKPPQPVKAIAVAVGA